MGYNGSNFANKIYYSSFKEKFSTAFTKHSLATNILKNNERRA